MPCEKHNWLFNVDCPKCNTDVDIPMFLRRNADGTFKHHINELPPSQSAERRKLEYAADETKVTT